MALERNRNLALPPLIALRAFEALGATGSIKAAAEALAVSPTVVSRHIDNLEQRLGAQLVERKGRSVALTEAGARFHAEIAKAFDQIVAATETLVKPKSAPLRLSCWPGLAVMRLLPRLPELEAQLPGYSIHLQPTTARLDLRRGEIDAEIGYRTGERVARAGVFETELSRPRVMPVASPSAIGRLARPASDIELIYELPWIHELSGDEWRLFLEAADLPVDRRAEERLAGVRLWHAHLAIGAARLGQGVALANELLIEDDLADGRLVEIGATDVRIGTYELAMRSDAVDTPPMRGLVEWLERALRLTRPLQKTNASRAK
jgi:LysR family transcriptional regulator, glycine cleavage system transcriptional activator